MSRLLPNDSPKSIATTIYGLGAASSSCFYAAAIALACSIFRKGASFIEHTTIQIETDPSQPCLFALDYRV